jgi:NTP pyrophosphatase (non-canonical NTP hydrolase)
MSELKEVITLLEKFRDDRDWLQFHNPKDLAIALNIETAELLQEFLWKEYEDTDKVRIKNELADVFTYAIYIANHYNFDISQIIKEKIKINEDKYPIEKSKGTSKKYSEL